MLKHIQFFCTFQQYKLVTNQTFDKRKNKTPEFMSFRLLTKYKQDDKENSNTIQCKIINKKENSSNKIWNNRMHVIFSICPCSSNTKKFVTLTKYWHFTKKLFIHLSLPQCATLEVGEENTPENQYYFYFALF